MEPRNPQESSSLLLPRSENRTPREFQAEFDLKTVPAAPGCYIMRDAGGSVIYVGKARQLRARVRQYINESDSRYSVKFLMGRVARIDFFVTATEKEAFLLENSLIKQFQPRYNFRLKDDKTYLSLRLNLAEDFPRVTVVRKHRKDGARYFGPYSSALSARETLRQLNRVLPLRKCSDHVMHNRIRPCLYHQMGQCLAPCVRLVDRNRYHDMLREAVLVLEGRSAELERLLRRRIAEHSSRLEFEEAAKLRDRLYAVRETLERQRTVMAGDSNDRDVFGVYNEGRYTEIQVLFFRSGKMLGGRSYSFEKREMPVEETLSCFLFQFYAQAPAVPGEVLLPMEVDEADTLAEILGEQRGGRVTVRYPRRGEKRALIDLANRNAQSSFAEKRLEERARTDVLEQLRDALGLSRTPERMECFDISTTQGAKAVGAMVTFTGGVPEKARYRRFSIRNVEGQDDFAMLREVLMRRYRKGVEENDLPDLVVIDGGRGQLGVATTVLSDLGIEDLDMVGIAKARAGREGAQGAERFFVPGRVNPIVPPQDGPVVHLMARLRDEAHRFAVTYHRQRRGKSTLSSRLTDIPGVGEKRARALLNKLGSIARIEQASVEDIASVPGFGPELAETVKRHLAAPTPNRKEKS